MASTRMEDDKQELARRGEEIFHRDVYPRVREEDAQKFVLIDVETGAYEIDRDEVAASDRLLARVPSAQVWMRRVGSRISRRMGLRQAGR